MPRARSGRSRPSGARVAPTRTRWRRFVDALQSNQNFEYLYWLQVCVGLCFDWTMRLIGPFLLLLATGLISGVIGMYFKYILPTAAAFGSISYLLHATWALFVSFNIFFNYYHCAFTHPGKPQLFLPSTLMSDSDDDDTEDDEEGGSRPLMAEGAAAAAAASSSMTISRVNVGGNSKNNASGNASINAGADGGEEGVNANTNRGAMHAGGGRGKGRVRCGYCKKCKGPKPARAHHCHVCDECVVNMDHHCPWMNNCVGYLNYRYFVLFLMYMFVGCAYAALISAPQFLAMAKSPGRRRKPNSMETSQQSAVMMTFVLALSVGLAISLLMGWHIYLICTAQTTIDFYQNQANRSRARQWGELWTNPFDVGCKGNWQQVFGPQPFLVGLLPSRRHPPPPVVEFFPLEEEDPRQRFSDEGEWTVDEPSSGDHIV
ncbi:unnamed protein product [Pylaiella littoralis]